MEDTELSITATVTTACKYTVASNLSYKQEGNRQKEVSFFDMTTWTCLAEVCRKYLKKGLGVPSSGSAKGAGST
ncbi:MAG: single-stranded DNA-binding protein [Spirochaetia bacterium]|jgi:single-strand DNA-binding protein